MGPKMRRGKDYCCTFGRVATVESLEDSLLIMKEEHHCTDQVIVYHKEKDLLQ